MDITIDTTGLSCPQPMLLVKETLEKQKSGVVTVLSDAEASRENISRMAKQLGWAVSITVTEPGLFTLTIQK